MDTACTGLHRPAQHPLADETQAYEAYPPVADANLLLQDPLGMGLGGELPQANWGQWWPPPDAAFAEAASTTAPNSVPQDPDIRNYSFDQNNTAQWESPASSAYSYPQPSLSVDSPSTAISTVDLESRRGSTATSSDKQKRKRNPPPPTVTKSTRRTSTRKATKPEGAPDKPQRRASKAKAAPQLSQSSISGGEEEEKPRDHSKRVQERNRVASNKFRVKKREDAKRLRVDEKEMERANQDLSATVSGLKMQVYELKMKLLQHTDCGCELIQSYISSEANRYIQDLGTDKEQQATPPIPPQHFCGS
ncbi:hypothetical protein ACHAPU_000992 [Fusarium lateritium]